MKNAVSQSCGAAFLVVTERLRRNVLLGLFGVSPLHRRESEPRMLNEAFKHVRYAVALRDCAQGSRTVAERQLLTILASIHERRGRALIGAIEARNRPAGIGVRRPFR